MSEPIYKRRFGDRIDGRLLRTYPPYNKFTPFIMKRRSDSTNYFSDSIEVTEIDRWLREKRSEGYKGMGLLHLFLAAYVRTVAYRPALNRFVSGQKVFARNYVEVLMTVKKAFSDDAEETTIKVKFLPSDTIFDIYRKIGEQIDEVKANVEDNGTDKFVRTFANLPRIVLNTVVSFLRMLDYFGWLPQSLLDISPFHGSMIITDLGSLGIPPVHHHIYDFGNLPVFVAFGAKRHNVELDASARPVERKYVDYSVSVDERTCDGFYMAGSFKYLKYYMKNPRLLEAPPEKVVQDIF
ncbi:MAG: hypothetical protein QMB62_11010 [Oscillospiraceae bacterium]